MSISELDQRAVQVVPSARQLAFQQLEFYAFIHFTVNTFTGKEWGDGTEPESIFNPVKMDAKQWVEACKSAGMKGIILTCKHHDGFCLWPSKYTEHSVKNSPYKDGKGDIVREVSDACREAGLKFGVYLSPWDRNNKAYGYGEIYDDYFCNQLTELLTEYGEVFDVWFDGACGEGDNGKKQIYDWERYYSVIRELQPNACINVCGPDIRWCGNEAGQTRVAEWSVVPARMRDTEKIAAKSQQADDEEFRARKLSAQDQDLGSREAIADEPRLIWYPAEVNTSIRPGWFYHDFEDEKVRSFDELIHIYYNSVGGNGTFLLNIPPSPEGLFEKNDVIRLKEIGDHLRSAFANNLMEAAALSVDVETEAPIEGVKTDDYETYFKPVDGETSCVIEAKWEEAQELKFLVLKENIKLSQRIETFEVDALVDGVFQTIYSGTVVGYKRIIPLEEPVVTDTIRIRITDSRVAPTLAFVGAY